MAVPPLASISMLVLLLTVPPFMEPAAAHTADADRIPLVSARVDLVDDDDAAVGAGASDSAISGQDGVVTVGQTQVAVAARGITDRRAAAGVDSEIRAVIDVAAVDGAHAAFAVAATDAIDVDRVPLVPTGVDGADDDDATVGAGICATTVSGRRSVTTEKSAIQRREAGAMSPR